MKWLHAIRDYTTKVKSIISTVLFVAMCSDPAISKRCSHRTMPNLQTNSSL